jgi:rubredoxin
MSYYRCLECGYIFENRRSAENHWRYDKTGEHSTIDTPEEGEEIEKLD